MLTRLKMLHTAHVVHICHFLFPFTTTTHNDIAYYLRLYDSLQEFLQCLAPLVTAASYLWFIMNTTIKRKLLKLYIYTNKLNVTISSITFHYIKQIDFFFVVVFSIGLRRIYFYKTCLYIKFLSYPSGLQNLSATAVYDTYRPWFNNVCI